MCRQLAPGTQRNQPPKPLGRRSAGVGGQGWLQDGSKDADGGAGAEEVLPGHPSGDLSTCQLGLQAEECMTAGSRMQVVLRVWRCPFWQHGQRGAACPQPCLPPALPALAAVPSTIPRLCSSSGRPAAWLSPSHHGCSVDRGGNVVTAELGEEELTSKENRR